MQCWQLNPQARLRRTPDGGAVFLPETRTTLELDAESFIAVRLLTQPDDAQGLRRRLIAWFRRNVTLAETDILLRELAARGVLLRITPREAASAVSRRIPDSRLPAPESVHLQLNNVCNLRCPSCYVDLADEGATGLPLERIQALLEEWVQMGVFQLALGGGEPLMSTKFAPVVRSAHSLGLLPNVTTNGWLVTDALLDEVQNCLGEIRLSLNDAVTVDLPQLETKAALLRGRSMRFGFNLIVTHRNLPHLVELLSWACAQGAASLTLVRPKPVPGNRPWYQENVLTKDDATQLRLLLATLEPLFDRTSLSVDCAFSYLFHGQPARELQARGVAGCAMGERFVTIKWNGDVYPCSHLHGEQFRGGNVRAASFQAIWEQSEAFTRVRRDLSRVSGNCGQCSNRASCRGCRAIMWHQAGDWLETDFECPHSVSGTAS